MNFLEFIATFESDKDNLESVLKKPEWTRFKYRYDNLGELRNKRDNGVPEESIPLKLVQDVCLKTKLKC